MLKLNSNNECNEPYPFYIAYFALTFASIAFALKQCGPKPVSHRQSKNNRAISNLIRLSL
jgi:hypothetical protein